MSVTGEFTGGTINISSVTGDIVITATASAAVVSSISALYTQTGTVYDTDTLDSLRDDLVVTATYEGGTTGVVTTYTLSGTLAEGTSNITVSYGGKTDTFTVTVTEAPALYPLADRSTTAGSGSSAVSLTISNGNHVKLVYGSSLVVANRYVNVQAGTIGSTEGINNQPLWFTVPAGKEAVLAINNVSNTSNRSFSMNFRKASSSTSGSFSIANGAHLSGETITKTLSAAEDEGCLFLYTDTQVSGTLEFDISFTVDGVRYI